jgi:hypothetical protein
LYIFSFLLPSGERIKVRGRNAILPHPTLSQREREKCTNARRTGIASLSRL